MKVAIIGAGLNGLASAAMLQKNGYEVEVFERSNTLRDGGTGIYLWPQGVSVLKYIFGETDFMSHGNMVEDIKTFDRDGKLRYSQKARLAGFDFTSPAVMFHRKTLFSLLLDQLEKSTIKFSMECVGIKDCGSQPEVYFNNGQSRKFDLIIGADGTYSKVREFINGNAIQPKDSGLAACRGIVAFKDQMLEKSTCQIYTHEHARLVTYSMNESLRYWFVAYQHNNDELLSKDKLISKMDGLPNALLEMIQSTDQDQIVSNTLSPLKGDGSWYKGSCTLVGDSIHSMLPTMGYGLTLGLENCFMLVQSLISNCEPKVSSALKRYENRASNRSQKILSIMQDFSNLYYFEEENSVSKDTMKPIELEFKLQTNTTVL